MQLLPKDPHGTHRPRVTSVKIERDILPLEGLSILFVARGSLSVHTPERERFVLGQGDLLCVGTDMKCSVGDARSVAEIILLRAERSWIELALALADEDAAPAGSLSIDRAGTDVARSAERLMRGLLLPPRGCGAVTRLHEASTLLELVALGMEERPQALASHNVRRAASVRRSHVLEALRALAEGPLYSVSLGGVAERLCLSERQVSRLVRAEIGTSFRDFLSGARIDRAKRLLAETDLAVIEIAAEAGWSSLSHFNTLFRTRVGITPTQFRASLRGDG